MSVNIRIDSILNIPKEKINLLMSNICESIMGYIIREGGYDDLYFNYDVKVLRKGYKKIKEKDRIIGKEECSICKEKFKENEYKRDMECGHVYHKKCIDKWLKVKYNCPMCRSKNI